MRCPVALDLRWDEESGPPPLREIAQQLAAFSPAFAYVSDRPATLWIEAAGLQSHEGPIEAWLGRVQQHLEALGWLSSAIWGCTAYSAALLASALPKGQRLMVTPAHQEAKVAPLPLAVLGLGERAERSLRRLGLSVLGDLRRLPRRALEARYGPSLRARLRLLAGAQPDWMVVLPEEGWRIPLPIDEPVVRTEVLVFLVKSVLGQALARLAEKGHACSAMHLRVADAHQREKVWRLCPARPSLNEAILLDLLRLRLESTQLKAPLQHAELGLEFLPAHQEQLHLFASGRRDRRRCDEGLDRLRAELGNERVYRAEPQGRYHPQEAVRWHAHEGAWPRLTKTKASPTWVRRLLAEPRRVDGPNSQGIWHVLGEAVVAVGGPYPLQQGWWRNWRAEDEYLVRTQSGRVFWLMHDRVSPRWLLIGWLA